MVFLWHACYSALDMHNHYGDFLGQQLVTDFANYASTVVAVLGNRVTYWTTFYEPNSICSLGFGSGGMAPGVQVCAQTAYALLHAFVLEVFLTSWVLQQCAMHTAPSTNM